MGGPAGGLVKQPQPIVDAFTPALARVFGVCTRSRADAVFAMPQPPLAVGSPDLLLDGTDGSASPLPGLSPKSDADRATRA